MENRIEHLIASLSEIFEGEPWYGDSVMKKLENLPHSIGYKTCAPQSHSVSEIVGHLLAWKKFALEKLKGNDGYDIELNSETDWPEISINTPKQWEELKRKLVSCQCGIYEQLREKGDDFLDKKVPRRKYNFDYLLYGLIQHDIYHLGQIGLIQSQIKRNDEYSKTLQITKRLD
ncbi:DinB family protein [Gramella sp. AN32]|uniref:DinB family protein n=1 Tax=Christiangramia antarctica TaxID=2058158 RepID=A0ABW5WZU6_9FLAO|nr:DinB family protein [Gramella sp. AN32]MCM4155151.1 hypothetical protein [Gramella sp. AN32]